MHNCVVRAKTFSGQADISVEKSSRFGKERERERGGGGEREGESAEDEEISAEDGGHL